MGPYLINSFTNEKTEFGDKTKFEIGRSLASDLTIAEVAISRLQCLITYSPAEEQWMIRDLSSFKSTRVNGIRVPSCGTYMFTGDKLSFLNLSTVEYTFYKNDAPSLSHPSPPESKRPRLNNNESSTNPSELAKIDELAEKISSLEEQNAILRSENSSMWRELKDMKDKFKTLEDEHEKNTNELILNQVVTEELRTDLACSSHEIELLAGERDNLAMELERAAAENKPADHEGDEIHRMMIPEIVNSLEIDALQRDLLQTKEELREANEKLEQGGKKEKVLIDAFLSIIDQELMCCICSETMFQPVVMNCKHTVCRQCLDQWKQSKKECPECRTKIKMETQPLLFDRLIDRIAPLLTADFLKKREEVKKERLQPTPLVYATTRATPVRRTTTRGGRGRQARSSRARVSVIQSTVRRIVDAPEIVDLTTLR